MFAQAKNTVAKAKLVFNKKLKCYKLVVAFNAHKSINAAGQTKYNFPTQSKCNYVSGDLPAETLQTDLQRVLRNAQQTLRTNDIQFVE